MNLSKLDLKIELSPSQLIRADEWLNNFYSKCKSRMSDPVVKDGFLKISSADIYNFLIKIECRWENELDLFRLKSASLKEIEKLGCRKRDPTLKNHYVSTLDSLFNFKL